MKKNKNPIIISTLICATFLLLTFFYYHIDKKTTGITFILLTLLILTLFILIVIKSLKGIIKFLENRNNLKANNFFSTLICLITLLYSFLKPFNLSSESLESEIEFNACYEGTQNQAQIKFRKDNTFELNWTGAFGYNEWWTGKWHKKDNILFLKYDNKKVEQLGDTILISNGYLNPIEKSINKIKYPKPMFYIGNCKNKN